jgi:hypothetical protein
VNADVRRTFVDGSDLAEPSSQSVFAAVGGQERGDLSAGIRNCCRGALLSGESRGVGRGGRPDDTPVDEEFDE